MEVEPPARPRGRTIAGHRQVWRYVTYVGAAAVVFGAGKVHASAIGHYDFTGSSRFAWSLAYAALLVLVAYGAGLPDLVRRRTAVATAFGATVVPTLAISVAQLSLGSAVLPRFVTLATPLVLVPWYAACAVMSSRTRTSSTCAVVVLAAEEAASLQRDLAATNPPSPWRIRVIAPEEARSSDSVTGPLVSLALDSNAAVLVLNRSGLEDEEILGQAVRLHACGVRVRTLERFYDEWLGKLPSHDVRQASLLFDVGEIHHGAYNRAKRVVDASVGSVGTLLLGIIAPLVAMLNAMGNRGPLLYKQPRVGRNGAIFVMYKFRTMLDGPAAGSWTQVGDARMTRLGRWLRRTHVDELPQVINILRGDLATVGPRPEQPHYVEELTRTIPFYAVRHLVRPGLTGWAQVNYSYGSTEHDAMEKLRYDLYYLQHQSLAFDVRILFRSLRDVIRATGR